MNHKNIISFDERRGVYVSHKVKFCNCSHYALVGRKTYYELTMAIISRRPREHGGGDYNEVHKTFRVGDDVVKECGNVMINFTHFANSIPGINGVRNVYAFVTYKHAVLYRGNLISHPFQCLTMCKKAVEDILAIKQNYSRVLNHLLIKHHSKKFKLVLEQLCEKCWEPKRLFWCLDHIELERIKGYF